MSEGSVSFNSIMRLSACTTIKGAVRGGWAVGSILPEAQLLFSGCGRLLSYVLFILGGREGGT